MKAKAKTVSVYYIHYNVTSKVLQFPDADDIQDIIDEEYTINAHRKFLGKKLNWNEQGRIHVATGSKTGLDLIQKKSDDEFKKILRSAFRDVRLPDISIVVQEQQDKKKKQDPIDDDTEPSSPTLVIFETKDKQGYSEWEWKFQASNLRNNNTNTSHSGIEAPASKCLLECVGSVSVVCEKFDTMVDGHVLRYDAKCTIVDYGNTCYDDCYGSEMDDVTDHADDELAYDQKGKEVIVGYHLQNVNEINEKAKEVVQKILRDELLRNLNDADVDNVVNQPKKTNEGIFKWAWNFQANDTLFCDCMLELEGSMDIVPKKCRNPKIPRTEKPKRWSTKASRRCGPSYSMKTNIFDSSGELYVTDGRDCMW
mmetsp:Transcript_39910/g.43254  ORF Transcript_39910/g.43254 Transcript_39910/m.43254 type:complete len:367 (+) Transcript_39910:1-1101(+)